MSIFLELEDRDKKIVTDHERQRSSIHKPTNTLEFQKEIRKK